MKIIVMLLSILVVSPSYALFFSTQPYSNTDTFIEDNYPTSTDGTGELIFTGVANDGGSLNIQRILIKFNVSSIPAGSLCRGATLYLTLIYADNPMSDRETSIYSLRAERSDWNYTQATWNEYRTGANWGTAGCSDTSTDYDPTEIATFDSPTSFISVATITLNASVVSSWFGSVNSNYGMMIKQNIETNNYRKKEWGSSRNVTASYRPKLEIEYDLPVSVIKPIILILGD